MNASLISRWSRLSGRHSASRPRNCAWSACFRQVLRRQHYERSSLFVSERSKPKITTQQLSVVCLIYERMDQMDLTGPFEVLSRMPDTSILIIGKEVAPA